MAASNSPVIRGRAGTYVVSQCIGKGAYGEVFLVKSKKERKLVRSMLVKVTAMTRASGKLQMVKCFIKLVQCR